MNMSVKTSEIQALIPDEHVKIYDVYQHNKGKLDGQYRKLKISYKQGEDIIALVEKEIQKYFESPQDYYYPMHWVRSYGEPIGFDKWVLRYGSSLEEHKKNKREKVSKNTDPALKYITKGNGKFFQVMMPVNKRQRIMLGSYKSVEDAQAARDLFLEEYPDYKLRFDEIQQKITDIRSNYGANKPRTRLRGQGHYDYNEQTQRYIFKFRNNKFIHRDENTVKMFAEQIKTIAPKSKEEFNKIFNRLKKQYRSNDLAKNKKTSSNGIITYNKQHKRFSYGIRLYINNIKYKNRKTNVFFTFGNKSRELVEQFKNEFLLMCPDWRKRTKEEIAEIFSQLKNKMNNIQQLQTEELEEKAKEEETSLTLSKKDIDLYYLYMMGLTFDQLQEQSGKTKTEVDQSIINIKNLLQMYFDDELDCSNADFLSLIKNFGDSLEKHKNYRKQSHLSNLTGRPQQQNQ